jgi:hypothetical protein
MQPPRVRGNAYYYGHSGFFVKKSIRKKREIRNGCSLSSVLKGEGFFSDEVDKTGTTKNIG